MLSNCALWANSAHTPLLGNRRSLFVERAKRGKQWAGEGFSIIHEERIQQPHILRSRIYVNSFQQTLQFPWIDWKIQNESLPHSKCAPYFNELQSIDNQIITYFKTNCRLILHREMLPFASNHLLICTISSRFLTQIAVSSASSCNAWWMELQCKGIEVGALKL